MKRFQKIMLGVLALCVVLQAGAFQSLAAEKYTYTVTFYAGDKGAFSGSGVQIESKSGKAQVKAEGSTITVTGLENGDRVGLTAAADGVVNLNNGGKYYVKGIRKSGYDNNTVAASSFEVTRDEDYVVAYGIRGEMVAYTVNFQDASGNALAESQTYYGNVGDKPVVAFLYVDGYVPEAYNLTKTLVSDESQNVFTFVYTPIPTTTTQPGGTTTPPGETPGTDEGTGTEPGGEGPGGAGTQGPGGEGAGGQGTQVVPEIEPPRELVDLDDEDTPLGNVDADGNKNPDQSQGQKQSHLLRNGLLIAGIAVVAAALGAGFYFFFVKRKKRSAEEEEEKSE